MNHNITCCFTGHRRLPGSDIKNIIERLHHELSFAINQKGYTQFLSGGAIGFDLLAAELVLSFQKINPDIKLIMALPCKEQSNRWSAPDIMKYNYILNNASEIIYTSESYYSGCMYKRNRFLIDNSSLCISYCTKPSGGTAYTVNYALSSGITVVNIGGGI